MRVTGQRSGHPFRPGGVGAGGDLGASVAPHPPRRAGAWDDPAQRPPLPFRHGGGWRCADPGASHPSAAAAASGDPVTSRASIPPRRAVLVVVIRHAHGVPSATAAGAGGGVPAYGGTAYCQRSILERSFIDQ